MTKALNFLCMKNIKIIEVYGRNIQIICCKQLIQIHDIFDIVIIEVINTIKFIEVHTNIFILVSAHL